MFAMPFGPLLAWKRGDLLGVAQRLMAAFGVGLVAVAAAFAIEGGRSVLAPFGVGLAFYVMAGALVDLVERTGLLRMPLATVRRARGRPAALGLGHGGGAFRHRGVAARHCRRRHLGHRAHRRVQAVADRVAVRLRSDLRRPASSDRARTTARRSAKFTVREGGVSIGVMEPSKRSFLGARR